MVDKELVQEELHIQNPELIFIYQKLSNRFLDWLFRHYYVYEYTEHFYDSCPSTPLEWEEKQEQGLYIWEDKEFLSLYKQLEKEYETTRLRYRNWIEVYGQGIWCMTQNQVDKKCKEQLKDMRSYTLPDKKDRIYITHERDWIQIYWYGRDTKEQLDRWFVFKKKRGKNYGRIQENKS